MKHVPGNAHGFSWMVLNVTGGEKSSLKWDLNKWGGLALVYHASAELS